VARAAAPIGSLVAAFVVRAACSPGSDQPDAVPSASWLDWIRVLAHLDGVSPLGDVLAELALTARRDDPRGRALKPIDPTTTAAAARSHSSHPAWEGPGNRGGPMCQDCAML
jgi:hypothetical protein